MKTALRVSLIALAAALGSGGAWAHEVSPPGEGSETHWIEHLNDPKPERARPRRAEGSIRGESATQQYCDPAFTPYYSTIGLIKFREVDSAGCAQAFSDRRKGG